MTLKTHDRLGNVRADITDFSASKFEIQLEYNTGWETIETPSPFYADEAWYAAKRNYHNLNLRLLKNGKRIAKN